MSYRRNGVREYVAWLVREQRIEWWELSEGEYVSLPIENGLFKSRAFPGLWLDASALLKRNSAEVLRRLQEGLTSPEHKEFAANLKAKLGS
jgi:hypothetical protein